MLAADCLQHRSDLAISESRLCPRAADHRYLKQQLERDERAGQLHNLRTAAAQMLANQVKVATQTTISASQPAIDAAVLESSKHSACKWGHRKTLQHFAITDLIGWFRNRRQDIRLIFTELDHLIGERKRVERVDIFGRVSRRDRGVSHRQHAATLGGAERDLCC